MVKSLNIIALAFSTLIFSCKENSETKKTEVKDTLATTADSTSNSVNDKEKEFKFLQLVASLPSPAFHVLEFKSCGVKQNETLCNLTSNSEKYNSPFKQSTNYGVYLADLAYLAAYKNEKGVKAYLEASGKMAGATGVKGKFDDVINNRHFIDHINNPDSIEVIIENIYKATDDFLVSDKHLDLATEVFIGSWIENSYITLAILKGQKQNEKNKALFNKVFEQKLHIANILTLLKEFENHPELASFYKQYEELSQLFQQISTIENVDETFISKLNEKIKPMRESIIS